MGKPSRVLLAVFGLIVALAIGFVGGMEIANELALRRSLLEAAEDTWILERFRSAAGPHASPSDATWMELMIKAKEGILLYPEYRRRLESDRAIQDFRDRTARLRQSRLRTVGAVSSSGDR